MFGELGYIVFLLQDEALSCFLALEKKNKKRKVNFFYASYPVWNTSGKIYTNIVFLTNIS